MPGSTGLPVGAAAPSVREALVKPSGEVREVPLAELYADKPLLLCFYTADFSPDCIEEWCSFRDLDWFASGDHVRVVGASKSRPMFHRKFIDALDLTFPMYADTDLELAAAFDVKYRTLGLFKRSRRSCFLIDTDGTVRYRWIGDHWLDPTRATPPVGEIHDDVMEILGESEPDTFGF